jgi:hypothetical protein
MITRDTLLSDLQVSARLRNALGWGLFNDFRRDHTVGDVLDLPADALSSLPNVGQRSVDEWERITAHLRGETPVDPRRLEKARTLDRIAAAHRRLAALYATLAELELDQ